LSFPANDAFGASRDALRSLKDEVRVCLTAEERIIDGFRDRNGSLDDVVRLLVVDVARF
jgi:hypothetical protein